MSLLLLLLGSGAGGPTVVTPSGLAAASALGTPTISVTLAVSGQSGTASVGTPTPTTVVNATVTPSGLSQVTALGTPVPAASIAGLQDEFTGSSLDTGRWTAAPSGTGITVADGRLTLASDYAIRSAQRWTLTGSAVFVRAVELSAVRDCYIALRDSGGNGVAARFFGAGGRLYVDATQLNASYTLPDAYWAGTELSNTNLQGLSGAATADYWVRWREASGTVYCETAPSTATNPPSSGDWTVRWSGALTGINLGALTFELYASSEATASEAYFDAVNTAATVSATVTPTALQASSALGAAGVSMAVPVSGLGATASRGTVVVSASLTPTGLEATSALGVAAIGARVPVAGLAATASRGTAAISSVVVPSALTATASRGTVTIASAVSPTGLASASAVGTIATVPGALQVAGLGGATALGTPSVESIVIGAAAPTTERWLAPRLPTDDRMVGVLQSSLDRLERTQGRAPVVMTDRRVTTAMSLTDSDGLVLVDCAAGGVTITLPVATAAIRGRSWAIKKVDSTSNNVTLDGAGSDTIDGAATYAWNTQHTVVWIQCALVTPPGTYGWVIV